LKSRYELVRKSREHLGKLHLNFKAVIYFVIVQKVAYIFAATTDQHGRFVTFYCPNFTDFRQKGRVDPIMLVWTCRKCKTCTLISGSGLKKTKMTHEKEEKRIYKNLYLNSWMFSLICCKRLLELGIKKNMLKYLHSARSNTVSDIYSCSLSIDQSPEKAPTVYFYLSIWYLPFVGPILKFLIFHICSFRYYKLLKSTLDLTIKSCVQIQLQPVSRCVRKESRSWPKTYFSPGVTGRQWLGRRCRR
jgi:hypothetical protein